MLTGWQNIDGNKYYFKAVIVEDNSFEIEEDDTFESEEPVEDDVPAETEECEIEECEPVTDEYVPELEV